MSVVEKEAEAQAERLRHLCSDENGAEFQKGAASFPSLQLPPRPVIKCGMMPSGRAWPFPVKSPQTPPDGPEGGKGERCSSVVLTCTTGEKGLVLL